MKKEGVTRMKIALIGAASMIAQRILAKAFAATVLDEAENPRFSRMRFAVGYKSIKDGGYYDERYYSS
jgi:putative NADH-flavin reductase